ncbi:hypothetical protein LK996_12205 [Lysobacter sp. A6]|uniref:YD repeat-containing protein n=1 Tax=Noviluteimonas lactosilytica TaxID=2888523 RepID=A0ABS8JJR0_9GAMM|nr:hypothetical protein [Lysobacter lactosilyticus]MCC8363836.1 hypothetical protein [Lysobacter lactosilyticus]
MLGDDRLRGKSIGGVRFSTFTYDHKDRAASTEHANGADRHTFAYTDEANGIHTVLHTNPLGKKATYRYQNHRMVSATGQASANCAASYREFNYDAKGREHIVSDFEGHLTEFAYDAHGRRTMRREAAGTALARTTTWAWNAQNQLASITLQGQSRRNFTYRSDGLLSSETVTNLTATGVNGQAHSTTYAYTFHPNTLVATIVIDGPMPGAGDAVTQTFDAVGNLLSVRNALGHGPTYALHNVFGQAGRETNANGGVLERSFDARGRPLVEARIVGTVRHSTQWAYNAGGKLASVTTPDGVARATPTTPCNASSKSPASSRLRSRRWPAICAKRTRSTTPRLRRRTRPTSSACPTTRTAR